MRTLILSFCLFIATIGLTHAQEVTPTSTPANATSSDELATPYTPISDQNGLTVLETRLLASHSKARPGQTITLAWEFKLAPHWHIYWKNAGDSGLPPELSAETGSLGLITFPVPHPISIPPVTNYGYEDAVTFTMPYTVPDAAPMGEQTLPFSGNFLYCNDVCLPGTTKLELPLIVATTEEVNQAYAPQQNLPKPQPESLSASRTDGTFYLTLPNTLAAASPRFIPSEDGIIEDSASQSLDGTTLTIRTDPQARNKIDTLRGLLLTTQGDAEVAYSIEQTLTAAAPKPQPSTTSSTALLQALIFALLAGLILNLMPCVLPVLGLKVMHLLKHHHNSAARARHTLAYTLGVLATFAAFAVVIALLKASGQTLGWGFHLQNPVFVGAMAFLMVTISLQFFGVFELGNSLTRLGATGMGDEKPWASFATGILAVLVATPCIVPFMGAAMAFALTQPFIPSLAVFIVMGLGMALPFLLASIFPSLLGWLPKPGAWMPTFRHLLGWPMLATALWLIYVYANQTSAALAFALMALLLLYTFLLWFYGVKPRAYKVLLLTFVMVFGLAYLHTVQAKPKTIAWQPWSEEAVNGSREETPVFVDFTADWCITCKVVEATVLNREDTQTLFKKHNTLLLQADWTKQSPEITMELQKHGRKGVPLYLLYLPGKKEPQILPQLLTYGILEDALAQK